MPDPFALAHLLDDACARHPDKLAVAHSERCLSFSDLRDLAARLAAAFADAGLAGERVATLLPNSPELIACYLGCWAAGAIAVPFEYVDAPAEIQTGLIDSDARWLIVHAEKRADLAAIDLAATGVEAVFILGGAESPQRDFARLLAGPPRTLPDVSPQTLAFILYTSGSTALPKGVSHSHASAAGIIASVLGALPRIDDRASMVVHDSVSHMGGWIEAFPLLACGGSIVLEKEFDAEQFYTSLRRWRPSMIGAHVDHLWQIVRHPQAQRSDFDSVDTVFTGGDELPIPLQCAFMKLSGLPIQVGWGMTEAIWLTIARQPELERRGFMGRPVASVELRLVGRDGCDVRQGEAGELWVRGPMVTHGYWRRPEADRDVLAGGWLRSGDMAIEDAAGNYWFAGRCKQIIERNSENITPGEIEQALYRHPAIAEAAAFGVPDPDAGEVPIAYIVFKPGVHADEEAIKAFLATQIAAFKIPVQILPIDAIPLTHSGKIDHQALANRYRAAGLARPCAGG